MQPVHLRTAFLVSILLISFMMLGGSVSGKSRPQRPEPAKGGADGKRNARPVPKTEEELKKEEEERKRAEE